MKKRIYIAACGIGLGHVSRCIAIANEIREKKPDVEIFISTYGDGIDFVKKHNYPLMVVPPMKLVESPDGSVDAKRTAIGAIKGIITFIRQVIREIRYIKRINPSIIISDTRLSTVIAAWLLRRKVYLITNQLRIIIPHRKKLTPLKKKIKRFGEIIILHVIMLLWNRSEKIFAADFPPELTISRDVLNVPQKLSKKIKFIGPILNVPHFEEYEIAQIRSQFLKNAERLIYVGLSGTRIEVESLRKKLEGLFLKFPEKYLFVMSLGRPSSKYFLYRKRNLYVYNWIPERTKLMAASDVYIGRSGQLSVAETFYLGVPAIWVPSVAHTEQITNALSSVKLGVGLLISQKKITYQKLFDAINHLLFNYAVKEKLREIKRRVNEYDGKKYLVNFILSKLNNIG
ncbi:MAG: hypothetical protein J7L07_03585 [Candidatus Odinarchaeota archaeon]|nr:hypothetical protein [Candidatus Odinarchaeota archaeon]